MTLQLCWLTLENLLASSLKLSQQCESLLWGTSHSLIAMFGWKPNSLAPRPILLLLCECSFGSWPGVRDFWFFNIFQLHSNRQNLVQLLILTAGFTIRDNPAQCPSGELHCKVSELWYQMASLSRTCERVRDLNPFLLKTFWNFKEFKVCTLAWHGH